MINEVYQDKIEEAIKDNSLDFLLSEEYTAVDTELLRAKLVSERFTISMIDGLSSRVYNHWKKSALLPLIRSTKIEYLSYLELFWVKIIIQLREFGLSLEKIRYVKNKLFDYDIRVGKYYDKNLYSKKYKEQGFIHYHNLLIYVLIMTIVKKIDVRLIVDQDGGCFFEVDPMKKISFPHISIPLLEIIKGFLKNAKSIADIQQSGILSESEVKVISLLKSDELKSITIKYVDGKPDLLKVTKAKKVDIESHLYDLFGKKDRVETVIKYDGQGKPYCEITHKHKLSK